MIRTAGEIFTRDTSRSSAPITPQYFTDLGSTGKVTVPFGAHDIERNNAVALVDYLAAH
jgi:uncharacterized protein YeaO (DUF488 family)